MTAINHRPNTISLSVLHVRFYILNCLFVEGLKFEELRINASVMICLLNFQKYWNWTPNMIALQIKIVFKRCECGYILIAENAIINHAVSWHYLNMMKVNWIKYHAFVEMTTNIRGDFRNATSLVEIL